jgi:predicted ArsR family transcriptional regulator
VSSEPADQPAPPDPAPPSDDDEQESMSITDPTVMRALAHPVRMALIELFGVHTTLTATQASESLGESPANCAFHLRTLAKYGFVEEAGGGRGRERPWKASKKSLRIRVKSSELDSEHAQVAAGALEQVWHDRLLARIRDVFANRRWSPEWEDAAGSSTTLTFLTPEELETVQDEISAILARHRDDRRRDPAQRPAGALPVEIVAFAYPRQDLAAPLPADGKDDTDDTDQNESDEIPGEPA